MCIRDRILSLQPVPLPIAALLVPVAQVALGIDVIGGAFAPFADPVIYLILASLFLAEALRKHGLTRRLALYAIVWSRGNFHRLVLLLIVLTAFLSMWVLNTATAAMLMAAEQVGAAARCLQLTVDYTKQRVQFGRPIGSFQALKHRMADLYVCVQSARAVLAEAIADPGATTAALARLAATETFCAVAGEAIQMHGGIAITWEHDIQLYFKRAHTSAQLLDPPAQALRHLESQVLQRYSRER